MVQVFEKLQALRHALLHLHKTLLDIQKAAYEQQHGSVSSGELLKLVIEDAQFAWLRTLSELIVRMDELLDEKDPGASSQAGELLEQAAKLLTPSETGNPFQQNYLKALQDHDVIFEHRDIRALLAKS
jgi:hypothetical protein